MDGIDLLRREALLKRNAAITAARREYHAQMKEIRALAAKLGLKRPGRPRKIVASDYSDLKATTVAREILREGVPMSLAQLTIEVQRRGCRSLDDPRSVAHSIDSGLRYYRREFMRDAEGRWSISKAMPSPSLTLTPCRTLLS
jgi:hypothetical protein